MFTNVLFNDCIFLYTNYLDNRPFNDTFKVKTRNITAYSNTLFSRAIATQKDNVTRSTQFCDRKSQPYP